MKPKSRAASNTVVNSPLPSKQPQFLSISRGIANAQASQQSGTVHSKSHLHPHRERLSKMHSVLLCGGIIGALPMNHSLLTPHTEADLDTPWAEEWKMKIWCVPTWGLWNIMCAPCFIWPQAAAARCHRLWDCSSQQQDMAVMLQPCSFSCSAHLPASACACSQCT